MPPSSHISRGGCSPLDTLRATRRSARETYRANGMIVPLDWAPQVPDLVVGYNPPADGALGEWLIELQRAPCSGNALSVGRPIRQTFS